jgi:hypothetical protein
MKTIDAKCQFCHKPIRLEIDDAYALLGDPLGLVPIAACNRCADLRVSRRELETQIRGYCAKLQAKLMKMSQDDRASVAEHVGHLLRKWCGLASAWRGGHVTLDEGMVEAVMARPLEYASILGSIWRLAQPEPELPVYENQ